MSQASSDERAVDFTQPVDAHHVRRIGRAWIELRRSAVTAGLREYLYGAEAPIEQGQMDALDLLSRNERTMRGLADRLRIDPSSATRAVQRLVADGLAERGRSSDDGRVVVVRITAEGRVRHAGVASRRDSVMARLLGEFSPEERADLARLLDRFVDALDGLCTELGDAATA